MTEEETNVQDKSKVIAAMLGLGDNTEDRD